MSETVIRRVDGESEAIGNFINEGFNRYSAQSNVALNYEPFCFTAESSEGIIYLRKFNVVNLKEQ